MAANEWASAEMFTNQANALKQGTGWNPILASRDGGHGRVVGLNASDGTVRQVQDDIAPILEGAYTADPDEWIAGNSVPNIWGYGSDTGTTDHPRWGTPSSDIDDRSQDVIIHYPKFGYHRAGLPGGGWLRSINKGSSAQTVIKTGVNVDDSPDSGVLYGATFKNTSGVNDAGIAGPSQYEMQTSMRQRDMTRAGSQISGTASEYNAPVKQHIPGMRIRTFAGGHRHHEMRPKSQDTVIRPFWGRTMGTGNPDLMKVNSAYSSTPLQRTPPIDPNQGVIVDENQYAGMTSWTQNTPTYESGFTEEDSVY